MLLRNCLLPILLLSIISSFQCSYAGKVNKKSTPQKAAPQATNDWAVRIGKNENIVNIVNIAAQMGASNYKSIGSLKHTFLLTIPSSSNNAAATKSWLQGSRGIVWSEQQFRVQRQKKVDFPDHKRYWRFHTFPNSLRSAYAERPQHSHLAQR